jgi:hypothetical protein
VPTSDAYYEFAKRSISTPGLNAFTFVLAVQHFRHGRDRIYIFVGFVYYYQILVKVHSHEVAKIGPAMFILYTLKELAKLSE